MTGSGRERYRASLARKAGPGPAPGVRPDPAAARGIAFALLIGTPDRAAPAAAFQSGQVGVFLTSLKAGGVGLNLAAADTVIHHDPW